MAANGADNDRHRLIATIERPTTDCHTMKETPIDRSNRRRTRPNGPGDHRPGCKKETEPTAPVGKRRGRYRRCDLAGDEC